MNAPQPDASPSLLSAEQFDVLRAFAADLDRRQRAWASGYLAGIDAAAPASERPVTATSPGLTILYGSQTGNGRALATRLESHVRARGIGCNLHSLAQYPPRQIARESHVVLIVSTHGDGDPPDDAVPFQRFLLGAKAPRLPRLQYAVLALGDSTYPQFCKAGRDLDERLAQLGARRLAPRVECDVDFAEPAARWSADVLRLLVESTNARPVLIEFPGARAPAAPAPGPAALDLELLSNQRITGRFSTRDIRHLEFALPPDAVYLPGDVIAIRPVNAPEAVVAVLAHTHTDPTTAVSIAGRSCTFEEALRYELELTQVPAGFAAAYAAVTGYAELARLAADRQTLQTYLAGRQIPDIVREYPSRLTAEELLACLRPARTRRYSIASAQVAVGSELHLTVRHVEYDAFGHTHTGAASGLLCTRLAEGERLPATIEPNARFHLPATRDAPVIMIGPGTGVAPFRGFLQAKAGGAYAGRLWLVFGNPHASEDFLYQTELQTYLRDRVLDRLDVAFSRDQLAKRYVQHCLLEAAHEVYAWLAEGAVIYVCGDARHMARDVEAALRAACSAAGGLGPDAAAEYLDELRAAGRYRQDVY